MCIQSQITVKQKPENDSLCCSEKLLDNIGSLFQHPELQPLWPIKMSVTYSTSSSCFCLRNKLESHRLLLRGSDSFHRAPFEIGITTPTWICSFALWSAEHWSSESQGSYQNLKLGWVCAVLCLTFISTSCCLCHIQASPLAYTAKWGNVKLLRWISLRHSKHRQLQIWLYWFIASEASVGITYYNVSPVWLLSQLRFRCSLMEFVWSAWTAGNRQVHDSTSTSAEVE